jgi:hypothetical protein
MKKLSSIDDYINNSTVSEKWKIIGYHKTDVSQVVVIPAYAEKEMLFSTLASLAQNDNTSLADTLILCVINNKKSAATEAKANNLQTIKYFFALTEKRSLKFTEELKDSLQTIADFRLNIGFIDASSEGHEVPENAGGVGMARKIGMDAAFNLLRQGSVDKKIIINLDADTLVQNNYLSSIKNHYTGKKKSAVVAYEHQEPSLPDEVAAISCYEIYLRYWVLGLKYANSPYAFHSIGSTMSCSADAYLEVRGMNKRDAGEDFYFLNKLAKIGKIGYIKETCVYPSARPSQRVPFGTGKRISRFLAGTHDEYLLYNPRIFEILGAWLELMRSPFNYNESEILIKARAIDSNLESFLIKNDFAAIWSRIRKNVKDEKTMIRQFNDWFDGFKTLKFINHVSREMYAPINMFTAVNEILNMLKISEHHYVNDPGLSVQKNILQYLRKIT